MVVMHELILINIMDAIRNKLYVYTNLWRLYNSKGM